MLFLFDSRLDICIFLSEKHQNQLQNIRNCSVPVVSLVVDDTSSENLPKVSKLAGLCRIFFFPTLCSSYFHISFIRLGWFGSKSSSVCLPYLKCVIAASNGDESDEKGKVPVVQQKGRFKVTSESVGLEKVEFLFWF